MKILFSLLTLVLVTSPLRAEPAIDYPKALKIEGQDLTLRGWGYRTATWLKVKVYHAGLYVEDVKADPLSSSGVKVIDLTFVHEVKQEDQVKAWKDSFEKNCASPCEVAVATLERFWGSLKAVKVGDKFRYVFKSIAVEVQYPSGQTEVFKDPKFSKLLLSTWIGRSPPTEALKKALLGSG